MRLYRMDLHVHTVLSPCAELEMGAKEIVQRCVDEEILLYGLLCSSAFGKYGSDFTANQVDKALWDRCV